MLRFRRLNVTKYTQENKIHYLMGDLLRQTTIKTITEQCKNDFTKEDIKKALLNVINKQIDLMIIEE